MAWGVYPRMARAAGVRSPRNPVCLDAGAYSRHGEHGADHMQNLYGHLAMAVRLYVRPKQTATVFCAHSVPGNVEGVACAIEKLNESNRRRVRVAVRPGAHGGPVDAAVIEQACERAWRAFHTPALQEVRVGYVFSEAHTDAPRFAAQLRALTSAHASGQIAFVGLALASTADVFAARAVLEAARVPVELIVLRGQTKQTTTFHNWDVHEGVELFAYNQAHALASGATHVSTSRHGHVHMRNWASALFSQAPFCTNDPAWRQARAHQ